MGHPPHFFRSHRLWVIDLRQKVLELERVIGSSRDVTRLPPANARLRHADAFGDLGLRHGHGPQRPKNVERGVHVLNSIRIRIEINLFRITQNCIIEK